MPVTSGATAVRPATILASAAASPSTAAPETSTEERSLTDQATDTLADCIKLKASLKACERLPRPASTGCGALAKSQFSNSVCKG